jgi:hypothetical protein
MIGNSMENPKPEEEINMSNENKPDMTPGTFAWNELAATDPAKCESFYHGAVWPAGPENGRHGLHDVHGK